MTLTVDISCPIDLVEVISDRLWHLGVMAIEELPADLDRAILRTTLGDDRAETERLLIQALSEFNLDDAVSFSFHEIDDNVANSWRAFSQPVRIGDDLVVVPSWIENPKDLDTSPTHVLFIEPGATFGLGDHPTTRASLQLLRSSITPQSTVLDVGCGSGILGIAALKFGARQALGIDINPASDAISQANAQANEVAEQWQVKITELDDDVAEDLLHQFPQGFEVITANILAPVLVSLAPQFLRLLSVQGTLIISGVLSGQFDHVSAALAPLVMVNQYDIDGWSAVAFVREPKYRSLHETEVKEPLPDE
ncbi:MAG: ribosomal protein methyltransferase [Actinomycetota bacterium]